MTATAPAVGDSQWTFIASNDAEPTYAWPWRGNVVAPSGDGVVKLGHTAPGGVRGPYFKVVDVPEAFVYDTKFEAWEAYVAEACRRFNADTMRPYVARHELEMAKRRLQFIRDVDDDDDDLHVEVP